ncbi:MAG TPA: glycosyltransferase [Chitinophagaceae bacterium]|jgi:glycosyltransferase involved in cell wall biosynthesis
MQNRRLSILWLPSWYPNKLQPFEGDFIQRHAQATSLYHDVHVIKIVSDENGVITRSVKTENNRQGSLTEEIIYVKKSSSLVGRLTGAYSGVRLYKKAVRNFIKSNGIPSLVHVHIGMKAGIIARWVKNEYHIPYLVTEHWSGFLPEANEKFIALPFYYQRIWKNVFKKANGISAVSNHLARILIQSFSIQNCVVIPNVVNSAIFFPVDNIVKYTHKFIHISGLAPLKNPEVIVNAFAKVVAIYPDAILEIFGAKENSLAQIVEEMGLSNSVQIHPEVPQVVLADAIRRSDALILYSSYETFGCVIIEANACGVPVIVSELPVFHETVEEGINGVFAGNGDSEMLARRMIFVVENKTAFEKSIVAEMTFRKFSYDVVGKQISEWYIEMLKQ